MTYRSPAPMCRQCDDAVFSRCAGCDAPQCVEHAVVHGERCPDCEYELHQRLASIRTWPLRVAGLLVAGPLWLLMTGPMQGAWRERMWVWGALPTGLALFDAALMTLMVGIGAGNVLVLLRKRHVQRLFQAG